MFCIRFVICEWYFYLFIIFFYIFNILKHKSSRKDIDINNFMGLSFFFIRQLKFFVSRSTKRVLFIYNKYPIKFFVQLHWLQIATKKELN